MKTKWTATLLCLSLSWWVGAAQAAMTEAELRKAEAELQEIKKEIRKLERTNKRNRRNTRRNESFLDKLKDKMQINGFMTAGIATSDSPFQYYAGADSADRGIDDSSYTTSYDSKAAIRFQFEVSDRVDVVTQLYTPLGTSSQLEAEWGYLSYQWKDNTSLRIGRIRAPLYYFSDFLDVGFAYPWVRPPKEVYNIPARGIHGIDMITRHQLYGWTTTTQLIAYDLDASSPQNTFGLSFEEGLTLNVAFNRGPITFRAAHTKNNVISSGDFFSETDEQFNTVEDAFGVDIFPTVAGVREPVEYTSLGFEYNDGRWWIISEATLLDFEKNTWLYSDVESFYLSVAYRFGKWLPYTYFSKTYTPEESDRSRSELASDIDTLIAGSQLTAADLQEWADDMDEIAADLLDGEDVSSDVNELIADLRTRPQTVAVADYLEQNPDSFDFRLFADQLNGNAATLTSTSTQDQLASLKQTVLGFTAQQQAIAIGVRYDIHPKIALKFEWNQASEFNGTTGQFSRDEDSETATIDDKVNIVSFVVDAIF